jgi:short-subunit dehydrogenase
MSRYIIIGASSGIGFQLAKSLSTKGHNVVALNRNKAELETLSNCQFHPVDISMENTNFPTIEGAIDGLIYCPGSINLKPFRALKSEDFLNEYRINFLGAVKSIKHYLPNLQMSETPSIVLFQYCSNPNGNELSCKHCFC